MTIVPLAAAGTSGAQTISVKALVVVTKLSPQPTGSHSTTCGPSTPFARATAASIGTEPMELVVLAQLV